MNTLQVEIISTDQISAELDEKIEQLAHLAFADEHEHDDPELDTIDWSPHIEYIALGYINDQLVTLLNLLRREILIDGKAVWVIGVGGVATHPNWQKRGFSSMLLQTADTFMREKMNAPFGLLVCAEERRSFYGRLGWKHIANELFFVQDGRRRSLKITVMILCLDNQTWPTGEIDLCGAPW